MYDTLLDSPCIMCAAGMHGMWHILVLRLVLCGFVTLPPPLTLHVLYRQTPTCHWIYHTPRTLLDGPHSHLHAGATRLSAATFPAELLRAP